MYNTAQMCGNQPIRLYFSVHLKVEQRAGQLSLLHVGVTKT